MLCCSNLTSNSRVLLLCFQIAAVMHLLWMWEFNIHVVKVYLGASLPVFYLSTSQILFTPFVGHLFPLWNQSLCVCPEGRAEVQCQPLAAPFFYFVVVCSSLLPSMGLLYYGVPDGSQFIKQHNDLIVLSPWLCSNANFVFKQSQLNSPDFLGYWVVEMAFSVVRVVSSPPFAFVQVGSAYSQSKIKLDFVFLQDGNKLVHL